MVNSVVFCFDPEEDSLKSSMDRWDLYIGVIGGFKIVVDGEVFFKEECFNLVEFGVLAARWLKEKNRDFQYKPLEFESVLVEFKYRQDGLLLVSDFSEFEVETPCPMSILSQAIEEYIDKLASWLGSMGYSFDRLVEDARLNSRT